jgi:hypothetical protein
VAIPAESGSLHGLKIERLSVPGRLGRLTVNVLPDNKLRVVTTNVDRFSIDASLWDNIESLRADSALLEFSPQLRSGVVSFQKEGRKGWKVRVCVESVMLLLI